MNRRSFLKTVFLGGGIFTLGSFANPFATSAVTRDILSSSASNDLKEASFYTKLPNSLIRCELCGHRCVIAEKKLGKCRSRTNINGHLYSLTFERPVAIHVDPVEKLPMRHILPAHSLLSVGTAGCNFSCLYCINSRISQKSPKEVEALAINAKEIVSIAKKKNLSGIAFTYNEPTIAYEFMYETFSLAKKVGLKTFFHSNGFMETAPLIALLTLTDGIVVDLKAFSNKTYGELTKGNLEQVKRFLKTVHSHGTFLEIVNLIVPGYNDNPKDIGALIRFVKEELSPDVPLHFSRFFPKHKLTHLPPTPSGTIKLSLEAAKEMGLHFAYANNINISSNNTICSKCGRVLVKRLGGRVQKIEIKGGRCPFCGQEIPGIWEV